MVAWIAERLVREGKRAAILTRGYGSDERGTSDEAKLLRARLGERVAIGVGADRAAKGRELVKQGVEWFVLDDGFQHLQLARDADIVLIDATNPFGGGHVLPSGHLREPKSALRRASVIVITRSGHAPAVEAAVRRESAAPIFCAHARLDAIRGIAEGQLTGTVAPGDVGPAFAFCGIGNPMAFIADLREWGMPVAGHKFFRDHHRYTESDDAEILSEAEAAGARALICTEKDFYNFHAIDRGKLPVYVSTISLEIDRGEEFWGTVKQLAAAKTPAAK
jgi:tetraacyldisaccharide 4'-kinase